jgi:integrase
VTQNDTGDRHYLGTKKRRALPLNQTVLNVLKERSKVRSLQTDLVFPSQANTLLEGSHLRRAFRRTLKKARIDDFRFHDLRHTFATRLVQAGVELYKVQRLLGHKSPMMTQRYAHHYPESLRDGVERLDRIRPLSQIITGGTDGRTVEAV